MNIVAWIGLMTMAFGIGWALHAVLDGAASLIAEAAK